MADSMDVKAFEAMTGANAPFPDRGGYREQWGNTQLNFENYDSKLADALHKYQFNAQMNDLSGEYPGESTYDGKMNAAFREKGADWQNEWTMRHFENQNIALNLKDQYGIGTEELEGFVRGLSEGGWQPEHKYSDDQFKTLHGFYNTAEQFSKNRLDKATTGPSPFNEMEYRK